MYCNTLIFTFLCHIEAERQLNLCTEPFDMFPVLWFLKRAQSVCVLFSLNPLYVSRHRKPSNVTLDGFPPNYLELLVLLCPLVGTKTFRQPVVVFNLLAVETQRLQELSQWESFDAAAPSLKVPDPLKSTTLGAGIFWGVKKKTSGLNLDPGSCCGNMPSFWRGRWLLDRVPMVKKHFFCAGRDPAPK